MAGQVRFTLDGPVARVQLSHPRKLNAMSRSMWGELRQAFVQLQQAPALRCVVLQGEGEAFCAGGDIRIAADGASFGAPIARLGFPMAPREAAAVLDAATLRARGFLQHVVAATDLDARIEMVAGRIAALAPQVARLSKRTLRALREQHDPTRRPAAQAELSAAYRYAPGAEHREGIAAFLAKRQPAFRSE